MNKATTVSTSAGQNLFAAVRSNLQTYALIVAMIFIWGFFSFMTKGAYMSPQNFSNLFRQMSVTAILSCGMVLVIVTGNIDLSVGKLAGFVSVVAAYLQFRVWYIYLPDQEPLAALLSVVIGLAVGLLAGVVQGYIIAYMRVPAFIVTLGGMWVFKGGILLVTEGRTLSANQPTFALIAQSYLPTWVGWIIAAGVVGLLFFNMYNDRRKKHQFGFEVIHLYLDVLKTVFLSAVVVGYVYMVNLYNGVQTPVLLLALVAVTVAYLSSNTRFGRYAYAIGGNREAARLSGVNILNNVFMVFVLMGFLCGISGVAMASYVGYGTIAAGEGYELDAIAACILGGTSTLGGEGTIFGAMVGALIMASLTNGLQIMNVAPAWQYMLKGLVLIVAVYADVYLKKR